ncbi:MAG: hypothetical protein BWY21_00167 [Parcubacteria group bacterium ADurb.Bin216]|nr:MAG: hypothetical protein BWY21_00167 [Parcubacteria group bacterium ADurb.Bin216]
MNKRYLLSISVMTMLLYCKVVFAMEYPDLPGIDPITEDSKIEDYATYFYAVIVSLMIAIATLKVAMTGLELLLSEGSPQAFSKFKNELIGVIVGIVILLSPFLVMKAINPNPGEREETECDKLSVCIEREKTEDDTGKVKKWIDMALTSQDIMDTQKITIKKYYGLQSVIGFNGGEAIVYYNDDPSNDDSAMSLPPGTEVIVNTPLVGGNGQPDPKDPEKANDNPGLNIISKRDGAFLYEQAEYSPKLYPPLFLKGAFTDLEHVNYKDNVKSIDIVNSKKDKGIDYFGIAAQNNVDKIEKCAIFYEDIPNVDMDERLKDLGGRMNYITIFKRDKNYYKDLKIRLIMFNNLSCSEKGGEVKGKTDQQLKFCEITLTGADGEVPVGGGSNGSISPVCDDAKCSITLDAMETIVSPEVISKACPNLGGEVYSFKIDTPSVITFLDNGGRCNIYDDIRIGRGEGDCNQVNFKGLATEDFLPKKFFIVPYNR